MSDHQQGDAWAEDLGRAEERIRALEENVDSVDSELRRLWARISNMPGGADQ